MQFENVIGQVAIKKHLIDLVVHNRLSHALLFLGKEGSGSLPMALAFAQYIVCTSAKAAQIKSPALFDEGLSPGPPSAQERDDSCGNCVSCTKAQQYIHPDIHFSFPVIPKKPGTPSVSDDYINEWREFITSYPYGNVYDWLQFLGAENKQGNITAEECNQINHKLSLKSFESRYKIVIMWMPEFLGKEGNKLLKLIEEPPPDTLFIFVAEDENAILPTILSRTQLIKIPLLFNAEIESGLINTAGATPERAGQVASLSEGNYREALQLLQHEEQDWQGLIREWLNVTLKNNVAAQLKWIEEISQLGREKQKQFIRYFIHLLAQALRVRFINEQASVNLDRHIPGNEKDFALRLNKLCSIEAQEAIINELDKAIFYIERNAHAKMLFHALSIRLYHIIKDNSLILVS
jgi:DNA polymerase III subunit delta'